MLKHTGKKFQGRIEFNRDFECECQSGRIAHDIKYSHTCLGYSFTCDSCGRGYLVALASMVLYQRTEVASLPQSA